MKSTLSNTRQTARYSLLSRFLAPETANTATLEQLLGEVVTVAGLETAGVRWPLQGTPQIQLAAGRSVNVNKWESDVLGRLSGARSSNDAFLDTHTDRRLYVPIIIDGRRPGVLWIDSEEAFTEDAIRYLVVVAQALAKHPAYQERLGSLHDQTHIVQRLQDASVVAGKIAHDFDTIFTGVVGVAEMVQSMLEPGSMPAQYLAEITSAGNRGISFTSQLHQLSRSGGSRPMPTSLGNALAREETRLKKSATQPVRLQFAVPTDLPPVAMEAGALQTVLGNLLDNALEASPPNGAIRVVASLVELSDAESREYLGAVAAGPYVEVRISDEGPGIREDYRKRLFVEPFFTTKVRHRGLGLPVAYRILHAHRAGARFETNNTRGSHFQIVLPLAAARPTEPSQESHKNPGGNH